MNDVPLSTILGIAILLGVLNCFFGYRFFKFILGTWGFLVGSALAGGIAFALSHNQIIAIVVGVIGGAIGGTTFVSMYFIGVFGVGAVFGGLCGSVILGSIEVGQWTGVLIIAAAAIGVGLVALLLQKLLISVATAFLGAGGIVGGLYYLIMRLDPREQPPNIAALGNAYWAVVACWLILGLGGLYSQLRGKRRMLAKAVKAAKD